MGGCRRSAMREASESRGGNRQEEPAMARTNDIVDDLNELLRDELAAIETYRHAIDRNRKAHGQDARFQQLTDMLHDHEQAAARLRDLVQRLGGTANHGAGTWGTWANPVLGAASLLGDK